MAEWHPRASKVTGRSAGSHLGGGRKIVWHTTEGSSAEGAIGAYRSHGGWPHFTLEHRGGRTRLFQHIPLSQAGRALQHPPGTPETNRARAIQVELVGFARESHGWSASHYAAIADLARWIESNFGVPSSAGVSFGGGNRMSGSGFFSYAGHCGHEDVPGNDHTDPGKLRIDLILNAHKYGSRTLKPNADGDDVREFQAHLNRRLRARNLPLIDEDGDYGTETEKARRIVTFYLGFPMASVTSANASPRVLSFVKDPDKRPPQYRVRARTRADKEVP